MTKLEKFDAVVADMRVKLEAFLAEVNEDFEPMFTLTLESHQNTPDLVQMSLDRVHTTNVCATCSGLTRQAGSCQVCTVCGTSTGCG